MGRAAWCASIYILRLINRIKDRKARVDQAIIEQMKRCPASCSEEEDQDEDEHEEMKWWLRRRRIEVFVMNALSGQCIMKVLRHPGMLAGDVISNLNLTEFSRSDQRVVVYEPGHAPEQDERFEYLLENETEGHVHLWKLWDQKAKKVILRVCKVQTDRTKPLGDDERVHPP